MSCRDSKGNSAVTSIATATGVGTEQDVQKIFHALKREGAARDAAAPGQQEVVDFLRRQGFNVRHDRRLTDARRDSILARLDAATDLAENGQGLPDGPTFHAWRHVQADCSNPQLVRRLSGMQDDGDWTPGARPARNHWELARQNAEKGVPPGGTGSALVRELQPGDTLNGSRGPMVVESVRPSARAGKSVVRFANGQPSREWGAATPVSIRRPADPQAALAEAREAGARVAAENARREALPRKSPDALAPGDLVWVPDRDERLAVVEAPQGNGPVWKVKVRPASGTGRARSVWLSRPVPVDDQP